MMKVGLLTIIAVLFAIAIDDCASQSTCQYCRESGILARVNNNRRKHGSRSMRYIEQMEFNAFQAANQVCEKNRGHASGKQAAQSSIAYFNGGCGSGRSRLNDMIGQ